MTLAGNWRHTTRRERARQVDIAAALAEALILGIRIVTLALVGYLAATV